MTTDTTAASTKARPLSPGEKMAARAIVTGIGGLGFIGLANSFQNVKHAAEPSFHALAWSLPVGIDVGILAFSALDLLLARLTMRPKWTRFVPWTLTGATVYLNVANESTMFGRIAHALLPLLWVLAVEVGTHVVKVRADLQSAEHMDRVRASRWILAPSTTARLWRRMILWEVKSYPVALERERGRLLSLADLKDEYGAIGWRWRAPRRTRVLYRIGELSPKTGTDAANAAVMTAPDAVNVAALTAPDAVAADTIGRKPAESTAPDHAEGVLTLIQGGQDDPTAGHDHHSAPDLASAINGVERSTTPDRRTPSIAGLVRTAYTGREDYKTMRSIVTAVIPDADPKAVDRAVRRIRSERAVKPTAGQYL